jgi:DNA-binding transcriptional MerR regulator/DNA-directed RNA polymerase subunit RPC12/RpoP
MSQYTTGELARLCGVSVRTVQYYDTRGILTPIALSEGGRRLYSEHELQRMKIICFLRDVGLSLNSISELFASDDPGSVITLLMDQQETLLEAELKERQAKLELIAQIRRELKSHANFSVESIGDIAYVMESRKRIYRIRATMLIAGLISEIIELSTLLIWIFRGIWLPYVIGLPINLAIAAWLIIFYFRRVMYICPQCHTIFRPGFGEMFFARHTMTTRRLTCTHCGHHGFCVETCQMEESHHE